MAHNSLARYLEEADWIFSAGEERPVAPGEILLAEGKPVDTIYFVKAGLFQISMSRGVVDPDRIGAGAVIGEMSFLDDRTSTVTLTALEAGRVVALPKATLAAKLDADPLVAAQLYRTVARSLGDRLRESYCRAVPLGQDGETRVAAPWHQIAEPLQKFKALLHDADRLALKNGDGVPETVAATVRAEFKELLVNFNRIAGDGAPMNRRVCDEIGFRVQRELLPYVLLTRWAERAYAKPRGYAGDWLTIDWLYKNDPAGTGRIGPILDGCALDEPAARAVRNRLALMVDELVAAMGRSPSEPVRATSLACGPAEEVFSVFREIENPARLTVTLVDMDLQALAHVSDRRDKVGLKKQMPIVCENLVYVALGRAKIAVEPQDLIYSIGLVDYFEDGLVIKLLNAIYDMLKDGGRVILGNFHPRNTTKAFMDYVLDWRLIHRTEADMDRLFSASRFGRNSTRFRYEEEQINLFAECVRGNGAS